MWTKTINRDYKLRLLFLFIFIVWEKQRGNKNEILRFNIDQQNVTHCHIQQISILKNKIITIITHKIGYKLY